MDEKTKQVSATSGTIKKALKVSSASQSHVQALSAHQLLTRSGNVNMLEGRSMHLNLFVEKKIK
jgi:hypothetical protein